ncbi:MAG: hypothetical protein J6B00_01865, partial [Alphaproteobacteria bacterium]|nr:hypothetical protein [Alphaproteobacteria bacterium]
MADDVIEKFREDKAATPKASKAKLKELARQKPPVERKAELPLDEGYAKTFVKVTVAVAVFLFAITLSGVLGINAMFEN